MDGWRIETLHLFRPLIFYTAFRSVQVLTQAFLSIGSLIEFGGYGGAVHVITDRAHHEFAREIPAINPASLTVQRVEATDWTGFVAAKYCLLEWEPAWRHQPVVFLDADIVCDADLDPFLAAAAMAGRLSAPAEEFSGLAHNPAVGADLLRRDGVDPGTRHGFNGGTLALPNLEQHGSAFALIRTIIANHADLFGRSSFRWVDQETANYVGVRTGLVDTTALTPFVRYMGQGDEAVTDQRRGLAHFWVPRLDGMAKEDAMLRYVQALRSVQADP